MFLAEELVALTLSRSIGGKQLDYKLLVLVHPFIRGIFFSSKLIWRVIKLISN